MKKFIYILIAISCIFSCTQKEKSPATNSINAIRPIMDTIITYSDFNNEVETEIVEYKYDFPDDIFWTNAIYKDLDGNEIRSIVRVLDSATRLPFKEYPVDEFGETDYFTIYKYDPNSFLLLSEKEYDKSISPENLSREVIYQYDDNKLINKTKIFYSTDKNYKNVDNNKIIEKSILKFLPNKKLRNAGNIETFYRIEKRTLYCTEDIIKDYELTDARVGDIFFTESTKFDKNDNPISYTSNDPSAGSEHRYSAEYYDVKLDKEGRISELIPYANENKDSIAKDALMWKFFYKDNLIEKVEEYMHNEITNKFDLIHGRDVYSYYNIIPELAFLSEESYVSEHFCQHRQVYSKYEKIIKSFDLNKRVVVYKSASMEGGFPKNELKGTVNKKVVTIFESISKK